MSNVFIRATVPADLLQAWLQHVRNFDTKHAGCHFDICADMPDMPMAEIIQRLQLDPELKFQHIFERKTE